MTRLLRGIKGPYAGAVFVIGERVSIGRASDSDIQILHPEVSRHHAKLVVDAAGEAVLIDLASDHGTSVNDIRIDRYVLQPGDSFCIHKCIFMYEEVEAAVQTSAVFDARVHSMESMRPTLVMRPLHPRVAGVRPREYQPLTSARNIRAESEDVIVADVEHEGWNPPRDTVDVDRLQQLPKFPPSSDAEPFTLEIIDDDRDTHVVSPMEFEALNDDLAFEIVFEGDEPEHAPSVTLHESSPAEPPTNVGPAATDRTDDGVPVRDSEQPRRVSEPALTRVELGAWGWIHDQEALLAGSDEPSPLAASHATSPTRTLPARDRTSRGTNGEPATRETPRRHDEEAATNMVAVSGTPAGSSGTTRRPRGGRNGSAPRWQPSGVLDVDVAQPSKPTWAEEGSLWHAPTAQPRDEDDDVDTLRVKRTSEIEAADEHVCAQTTQTISKDAGLRVSSDICEFRSLRARKVQLGGLPTVDELRLATLQARLHAWASGRSVERHFRPEGWTAQGCLLHANEGRVDVRVREISVNGVRVVGEVERLAVGDALWFALDVSGVQAPQRHLVFKARVAWSQAEQRCSGLLFIGPARYVDDPESALPRSAN